MRTRVLSVKVALRAEHRQIRSALICAAAAISAFALLHPMVLAQEPPREKIGEVIGKVVFRGDLPVGNEGAVVDALHRLFATPVLAAYKADHREEIAPSEGEIEFAIAYFRKDHDREIAPEAEKLRTELAEIETKLKKSNLDEETLNELRLRRTVIDVRLRPPGREFAEFMLGHWKFERHLYEKFGGGRVLFQQAGLEAFDAMHEWLKQQEKKGTFRIDDERLRTEFYAYWTTKNHGAFLTSDRERIREFLNPPWVPATATQPASRPADGG